MAPTTNSSSLSRWRQSYAEASPLRLILYLNVALYLLIALVQLGLDLWGSGGVSLKRMGALLPSGALFLLQPWGLLTYSWLHDGLLHLAGNMLLLYVLDKRLLHGIGQPRLVALYLVGGLWCAVVLLSIYMLLSALGLWLISYPVFGASGAVLTLLGASTALYPNRELELAWLGRLRQRDLLLGFIVLDVALMLLFESNWGGHVLHLAGVLLGLLYGYLLRSRGIDLVAPLLAFYSTIERRRRRHPLPPPPPSRREREGQKELNDILDKVRSSSYSSLTPHERELLSRASEEASKEQTSSK